MTTLVMSRSNLVKRKNAIDALDVLNKAFDYAVNDDGRALNGDIGAALM